MSQTQHAGLAFQEVDGTVKGYGRRGSKDRKGNRKKLDSTYQEGQEGVKRAKTT